jgi:hypothetical protein
VPDAETAPSAPDARDDLLEATYSRVFLRIIPFLMVCPPSAPLRQWAVFA